MSTTVQQSSNQNRTTTATPTSTTKQPQSSSDQKSNNSNMSAAAAPSTAAADSTTGVPPTSTANHQQQEKSSKQNESTKKKNNSNTDKHSNSSDDDDAHSSVDEGYREGDDEDNFNANYGEEDDQDDDDDEEEDNFLSRASWFQEEGIVDGIAGYLPTVELLLSFQFLSTTAFRTALRKLKERETGAMKKKNNAGAGTGGGAINVKEKTFGDLIAIAYNKNEENWKKARHHTSAKATNNINNIVGSMFIRSASLQPGYLTTGVLVGGLCQSVVALGPFQNLPIQKIEGLWYVGSSSGGDNKNDGNKDNAATAAAAAALTSPPYPYRVTVFFESGLQCTIGNIIGAVTDVTNEDQDSPYVEVGEVKIVFPPQLSLPVHAMVGGSSTSPQQQQAARSIGSRSVLQAECEFQTSKDKRKSILGSDALAQINLGTRFAAINEIPRSAASNLHVTLSIIIDGFSHTTTQLQGVGLHVSLAQIRKLLSKTKVLLPEKYNFKRYTAATASIGGAAGGGMEGESSITTVPTVAIQSTDDEVDTVFDALPYNRGQFLRWEISQNWPVTKHCGWPEGVQVLHNRVLALVVLPSVTEDDHPVTTNNTNGMGSMMASTTSGANFDLPTSGVQRAKAIRNRNLATGGAGGIGGGPSGAGGGGGGKEAVASMQLMFHVMNLGYECCRNGDLATLELLIKGGQTGSTVQRVEGKDGRKLRQAVTVEYPALPVDEGGPLGVSLLHTAVDSGRKEIVEFLLQKGASVCSVNHLGELPLHVAAQRGHAECIPLLLRAFNGIFTINIQDVLGRTPLHLSLAKGFINTALWLVEQGADVNILDSEGRTPCAMACRILPSLGDMVATGNVAGTRLMLKTAVENHQRLMAPTSPKGSSIGSGNNKPFSPTNKAGASGSSPVVSFSASTSNSASAAAAVFEDLQGYDDPSTLYIEGLKHKLTKGHLLCELDGRYSIDRKTGRIVANVTRNTALHIAVESEHAKIVSLLVQSGLVDPCTVNTCGDTALHRAAAKGNVDVLQTLLAAPAARGLKSWGSMRLSPKERGGGTGKQDFLAASLNADGGSNIRTGLHAVSLVNQKGQYPLHLALHFHCLEVAAILVAHATPMMLRQRDSYGTSACQYALCLGDAHLQLTQEIISNSLMDYHLRDKSISEENHAVPPFYPDNSLHRAYCRRFNKTELPPPTIAESHFASMCETAVARKKLSTVQFLIGFMKRCIAQDRWPVADFGSAGERLLLTAFNVDAFDVYCWLEKELNLDASAFLVPYSCGSRRVSPAGHKKKHHSSNTSNASSFQEANEEAVDDSIDASVVFVPLAVYVLLRALDLQWVNHILENEALMMRLLKNDNMNVNLLALLVEQIASITPSGSYTQEAIPTTTAVQHQRALSPTEKRKAKKAAQWTHKNYVPRKREVLSTILQSALNALTSVASSNTLSEEESTEAMTTFRRKVLNAAFRCQAMPATFIALEKFLADHHSVETLNTLGLLTMGPHYHVSPVQGVNPVALIHGGEVPVRGGAGTAGTAATSREKSTATGRGDSRAPGGGRRGSVGHHSEVGTHDSNREGSRDGSGTGAGKDGASGGAGGLISILFYPAVCIQREKQLCRLIPYLIPDKPGHLLYEFCRLRYFAAALNLVQSPSAVPFGTTLQCPQLEKQYGKSALHLACEYNASLLVSTLLASAQFTIDEECSANLKPIHYACRYGHSPTVTILLAAGADVNSVSKFYLDDSNTTTLGVTPLHFAAQSGSPDLCKMLLDHDASVEAQDTNLQTPLHYACQHGHEKVAVLLLQSGANVEREDCIGETPILLAAKNGLESTVLSVIATAKADHLLLSVNPKTGQSLAHFAAWLSMEQLLEGILAADRAQMKAFERNKVPQPEEPRMRHVTASTTDSPKATPDAAKKGATDATKTTSPVPSQKEEGEEGAQYTAAVPPPAFIQEVLEGAGGAKNSQQFPYLSHLFCGQKFHQGSQHQQHPSPQQPDTAAAPLSTDWLSQSKTSAGRSGLSMLRLSLLGETGVKAVATNGLAVPTTAAAAAAATNTKHEDPTAVSAPTAADGVKPASQPPLQILSALFSATANERKKTGNLESHQAIGKVATLLQGLAPYSTTMKETLDPSFTQNTKAQVYQGEKSILLLPDRAGVHQLTPLHYIFANGRSKLCSIAKQANMQMPEVLLDCEVQQRLEADRKRAEEEEAKRNAKFLQFPQVGVNLSDALQKRAQEVGELMQAKPPPPPAPTPRWIDGYYGLGLDGVTGHFAAQPFQQWCFNTTRSLFTSRNLQTMIWMVRRNMSSEIAVRIPMLPSVDTHLDDKGTTLLMHAAYFNKASTVKTLIEHGANVNAVMHLRGGSGSSSSDDKATNVDGQSVADGQSAILDGSHHTNENENGEGGLGDEENKKVANCGLTPLLLACFTSSVESVELLLSHGADPNAQDECGNTPLHHCVARKHFILAKILLRAGANIELRNHVHNELPEDISVQLRDKDVRRLLYWWGVSGTVKSVNVTRSPCHAEVQYKYWDEASKVYYKRLDLLHKEYISLMNQAEEHSVPCLLYNRICKLMGAVPARSVLNQLRVFWWPEEVRHIDLGGIYLGVQGISTVVALMKVLPRLEMLDLSGSKLTLESISELCSFALQHHGLRRISVRNNKDIGKLSATKIIDLLKTNPRIVMFDVTETAIETHVQANIARLADANKRTQSLGYSDLSFKKAPSPTRNRSGSPHRATSPEGKYMTTAAVATGADPSAATGGPQTSTSATSTPQATPAK